MVTNVRPTERGSDDAVTDLYEAERLIRRINAEMAASLGAAMTLQIITGLPMEDCTAVVAWAKDGDTDPIHAARELDFWLLHAISAGWVAA